MAKITLGGERIGQGDKMKVNIPHFDRSSHDIGRVFTTDAAFGTVIPAFCEIGSRGDVFYFNDIESLVRTLPTSGPVFGLVKMQVEVYKAPIRLYVGPLHNNATGIGLKMAEVKLPQDQHVTTTYQKDIDPNVENPAIRTVAPDSLQHYLGMKASPKGENWKNVPYRRNALHKMMYWDVYKNYYANKQEEEGVVITGQDTEFIWNNTSITMVNAVDNENYMFTPQNNTYGGDERFPLEAANSNQYLTISTFYNEPVDIDTAKKLVIHTSEGEENVWDYIVQFQPEATLTNDNLHTEPSRRWIFTFPKNKGLMDRYIEPGQTKVVSTQTGIMKTANIQLERFPLKNIDMMREAILATPVGSATVIYPTSPSPYNVDLIQYTDEDGDKRESMSLPMCGLGIKTHLSDRYNNWLQTDWIDGENGINELTKIDTSTGSFTVNEFILDYKLFRMMNRIAISDGSYDAWQTAVYGEEGEVRTESPVYCGGYSCEIGFDEVVSKSATAEEPLGSLAGRGSTQQGTRKGGRNIKIKCTEATLIMVVVSFTPRLTYPANNAWWTELQTMDDFHKPDLDGIAFQNLTQDQMAGYAVTAMEDQSSQRWVVGKQTSWVEYTTAVNETHGSFVPGEPLQHMVFNRRYRPAGGDMPQLKNTTTYVDPTEFNVVFADEKLAAKPFWVQIGFDVTARRKMSAQQVPLM